MLMSALGEHLRGFLTPLTRQAEGCLEVQRDCASSQYSYSSTFQKTPESFFFCTSRHLQPTGNMPFAAPATRSSCAGASTATPKNVFTQACLITQAYLYLHCIGVNASRPIPFTPCHNTCLSTSLASLLLLLPSLLPWPLPFVSPPTPICSTSLDPRVGPRVLFKCVVTSSLLTSLELHALQHH